MLNKGESINSVARAMFLVNMENLMKPESKTNYQVQAA